MLAVGLLAFASCKKSDPALESAQAYHGVEVDWPKLETEFASAGQDVQGSMTSVKRFLRYGQFPEALMELDKLTSNSSLTEPQKKLITSLIDQIKKAIQKTPPAQ